MICPFYDPSPFVNLYGEGAAQKKVASPVLIGLATMEFRPKLVYRIVRSLLPDIVGNEFSIVINHPTDVLVGLHAVFVECLVPCNAIIPTSN